MTAPTPANTEQVDKQPEREVYVLNPPDEYTYDDYLDEVAAILAALVAAALFISRAYQRPALSRREWLQYLVLLYPYVTAARDRLSIAARQYYDWERLQFVPPVELPTYSLEEAIRGPDGRPVRIEDTTGITLTAYPRFNFSPPTYEPEWFESNMEPEREKLSEPETPDAQVFQIADRLVKEALDAPRTQTMWAVQKDPRVKGWARVEGNENVGSCGFCLMLISRGPVYNSEDPRQAGLNVSSNTSAVEIFRQARATNDYTSLMRLMTRWHPNCDCQVVPVFDTRDWEGRDQFLAAQQLWNDVIADFKKEYGRDPRQGKAAKGHEALNALRRRLRSGDLPQSIRRPQRRRRAA